MTGAESGHGPKSIVADLGQYCAPGTGLTLRIQEYSGSGGPLGAVIVGMEAVHHVPAHVVRVADGPAQLKLRDVVRRGAVREISRGNGDGCPCSADRG